MSLNTPINKAKQRLNTLNDMLKLTLSTETRLKLSEARDKLADAVLKSEQQVPVTMARRSQASMRILFGTTPAQP